ncbi:MAG: septation ring formation regulator EzrA [Bacilli bacterium]|nr:septation ring formation regulator EzrA [Bacilli bacterium]
MDNITIVIWSYFIVTVILITVVLTLINKIKNNKYKKEIDNLEKQRNLVTSIPVAAELNKVKTLIKNDVLQGKYHKWENEFELIKDSRLIKISDMILDLDSLLEQKDYEGINYKIPKVEFAIYRARARANFLLNEMREITLSEEKNREIVTKLKAVYRELCQKFNEKKQDYGEIIKPIELQLENIHKRFQEFEEYMEKNDYEEVSHIVKALDEMINNMSINIEEIPSIILITKTLIPKKLEEIESNYKKMTREGYQLDYLNTDYNITEINKKISTILDKAKVLNVEDSMFELKTMLDYLDSLFNDFDNEKMCKNTFEENVGIFKKRINKISNIVTDIYKQLDDIKQSYDLSDGEIDELDEVGQEINALSVDYNLLIDNKKKKVMPYSKMDAQLSDLNLRLTRAEERLDDSLRSIGSMHEDELRAREQLDDINDLLTRSKRKIREYKLPIIPQSYYVELKEASDSIKEIMNELDKKPIAIKVLNIRVDTARDLVLKLYTTTNEMVKTAMLTEMAIVYGNRYRTVKNSVEQGLNHAEVLFNKGDYRLALETSINTIELVEPGAYQQLLDTYSNEAN